MNQKISKTNQHSSENIQRDIFQDDYFHSFSKNQEMDAFDMFREPENDVSQLEVQSLFDVNEYFSKFDKILLPEKVSTNYEYDFNLFTFLS